MPDKESKKIDRIEIKRAENGFVYCAYPKMDDSNACHSYRAEEYVYESIDEVLDAVRDDLSSPHMRGGREAKDSKPEMVAAMGKKSSKTYGNRRLFK